jgi:hypothetical protein
MISQRLVSKRSSSKDAARKRGRWLFFTAILISGLITTQCVLSFHASIDKVNTSDGGTDSDWHKQSSRVQYVPNDNLPASPVAAEVLLGVLKISEPQNGKALPEYSLRARIETFRKLLKASHDVRRQWNDHFNQARDRGIVIAAGRAGAIINSYVVLHTLRKGTGSRLPVVLAHYGEEEFKNVTRAYFKATFSDIEFLDLKRLPYPDHHVPLELEGGDRRELGYKLKIFAIYAAPFRELIFLDSDSVPLQDPEKLFETESYKSFGNMFWNDFWKEPVPLWQILQLSSSNPWMTGQGVLEAESGQIVFDRVQYWEVLEWVLFLNTHDSLTYRYSMGDKDTFRVAYTLAGKTDGYNASPLSPALPLSDLGAKGEEDSDPPVRFRCLGMLQLHPENGTPFFHHRTADSKFHAHSNPGEFLSSITHLTPPVTSDQASIMNWGLPGQSIHHATGRVAWGLRSESAMLSECQSIAGNRVEEWPVNLDKANELCSGRNASDIELNPEPILVLKVPSGSFVDRISRLEVAGYNQLPFQESDS